MVKNKMRRSIFDLMNDKEINVEREYLRIHKLFEKDYFYGEYGLDTTMSSFIEDEFFINWDKRGRYVSLADMFSSLNIKNNTGLKENTVENLLLYIEVIINLIEMSGLENVKKNYELYYQCDWQIYRLLKENIERLLEDLNYEIKKLSDKTSIIVEKDMILSSVAETNKNVSDKVIEYRRFMLKGKVSKKREILNLLANEIEGMKPIFKGTTYSNLMDDVQFMLNNLNIRHNNIEGKNKKEYITNLSKSELEKLYDKTFDMILSVFVIDKYLKMKNEIDTLKNEIK